MSRNFGFGLDLGLFSVILNNRSKTWKSQGLFFHVLGCNITIDGKFSIYQHCSPSRRGKLKKGFIPIKPRKFVEKYLKSNPGYSRKEITSGLKTALDDYKSGVKCDCGSPIWVIGSAVTGNACFSCITGEAIPDDDYEIDEACK
jgi:hypothetical protein